jgi:hypothetical protein
MSGHKRHIGLGIQLVERKVVIPIVKKGRPLWQVVWTSVEKMHRSLNREG